MKRLVFFIILSLFAYSSNTIVLSKKENNKTEEIILIKKWLINKYNSIMPNFLNIQQKERMFDFKISYSTKDNKIKESLNAKIIFPELVKIVTKNKNTKKNKKNPLLQTQYKFKILPLIRLYKHRLTPILKTSFDIKNFYLLKTLNFNETFYFYFLFNEYKETTTLSLNRFLYLNNLMFKISKTYLSTDKSNLYYLFGIYYYSDLIKFIRTYGFEMSGERKKLPFIYSYKLFFTYRHILFGKRYIFANITPYIQASKEWNYKVKPFLTLSFNIRF